jgi:hypothetical protein
MKTTFKSEVSKLFMMALIVPLSILYSCQKKDDQVTPTLTESLEKIETLYEGGEKIETVAGSTQTDRPHSVASEAIMHKIKMKIAADLSDYKTRFKSARTIFAGYDVGVPQNSNVTCPSWSESIAFKLDAEDDANDSYITGWTGKSSLDNNGNVWLNFCRVDGRLFSTARRQYSVLSLGANRPASFTSTSSLYVDNEDHNTANDRSGDIGPNVSTGNTTLYFYTNTNVNGEDVFPDFGFSYGVFIDNTWQLPSTGIFQTGFIKSDDEMGSNANSLQPVSGTNAITRIAGMNDFYSGYMAGIQTLRYEHHTWFYFVRVR